MNNLPQIFQPMLRLSVVLVISFVSFASVIRALPANGSTRTAPERGTSTSGRSFTLSDIETISNFGGELGLNIPVGSLAPGRGGLNASLNLHYSSKIWDMMTSQVLESTITTHDMNILNPAQDGNWRYQYSYRLRLDGKILPPDQGYCFNGNSNPWKLQLILPDGSMHSLYLAGFSDEQGFMNVLPDGRTACPNIPNAPNTTSTVTYFTTDGTYLRLDMLQDGDSPDSSNATQWGNAWKNNKWILYMPDGGRVVGNPEPSDTTIANRIYDRNENYIDVIEKTADSAFSNRKTTTLKDQLGRKVVIEYEAATNQDWIHSPGFNGADIITKVLWKEIRVNQTYHACDYDPPPTSIDFQNFPLDQVFRVVDKVYLPVKYGNPSTDDLYYTFGYNADSTSATDSGWGELNYVKLPSNAYANYSYYYDNMGSGNRYPEWLILNRPVEKELTYDKEYDGITSAESETWSYTPTAANSALVNLSAVTVTGPDGGSYKEYYANDSIVSGTTIPEHKRGEILKSESADGSITERYYASNVPLNAYQTSANRFVKYEYFSPKDASGNFTKTAIKEYSYDKNGNPTTVKEYDFVTFSTVPRNTAGEPNGLPSGATAARITKTEYYNDTPDSQSGTYDDTESYWLASSPRLRNLPKSVEVQDGSNTPKSRSEVSYDYTTYSSNTKGGNITQTTTWDSFKDGSTQSYSNPLTSTNSISTSATYNDYGMPVTTTDAKGVVTTTTYGNVTVGGSSVTGPYPTQTEAASNYSTLKRTSTSVYDFHTGLVTSSTDEDNDLTNSVEYDDLGRPVKSIMADGTALESWTQTDYNDVGRFVVVKSDLVVMGDGKKVATQFFDQLGRVRLSKTLEDAATQSATNETDGIKVQTRYKFASGYTYQLASNPYRAANSASETDPTMGWTLSTAWSNGRRSEVQTFTGSGLPTAFGGSNGNSTGIVRTDIDSERTLVTDQAGKSRISKTNALGQLKEVWEILAASESGSESVSFPGTSVAHGFKTSYSYDALGKMVHVQQDVQHRWFMYDSLGRLLRVKQPEQDVNAALNTTGNPGNNSWTAGFTYDNNGNVLTAKDAKNTEITNTYDALNRPLTRSYSDGTPTVTNYYDGAGLPSVPSFSKGKLTRVSSSVSDSSYTDFDPMGRLEQFQQITDGQTYTSSYEYNLSGALTKETYPSGRVVQNEFDANGDLSKIFGRATTTAIQRTYANNFTYSVDGKIEKLKLGSGVWESAKFNSRLQVTELSVGWGPTSGSLWRMQTEYGELQTNGTVDATKNSGNIGKQTVSFAGLANPFVQNFKYDSLYRLTEAKETNNSNQTWKQNFTYDRYGNRLTHQKYIGTTETTQNDETHPEIDPENNQFKETEGYTFDANGNVIVDFTGRQFTFNGDNKQTQVKDAANKLVGKYLYDGEGKRVKKLTYDQYGVEKDVTVFVYSGGKLIAEYTTEAPPTNPTTRFTVTDGLGSPRVILDSAGEVVSRRDFLPFGEEIDPDETYRKTNHKYGEADQVRQKFTGYEHDDETGLDFAEARMYENRHGRFTAVDPLLASGKSDNPQTFNRYVYVGNDPVNVTDPLGLDWIRSKEKDKDGNYTYHDVYGKELKSYLKGGDYERIKFEDGKSQIIARNGIPIYEMFEKGRGRELKTPSGPDATQMLVDSVASNAETKSRAVRVAATAAGVTGVCVGTAGAGCLTAAKIGTEIIKAEMEAAQAGPSENTTTAPATVGSYLHTFESGNFYAGKGTEARMKLTGKSLSLENNDPLRSSDFFPAISDREAFIGEHKIMMENGGPRKVNDRKNTYNKIFSPGRKFFRF